MRLSRGRVTVIQLVSNGYTKSHNCLLGNSLRRLYKWNCRVRRVNCKDNRVFIISTTTKTTCDASQTAGRAEGPVGNNARINFTPSIPTFQKKSDGVWTLYWVNRSTRPFGYIFNFIRVQAMNFRISCPINEPWSLISN